MLVKWSTVKWKILGRKPKDGQCLKAYIKAVASYLPKKIEMNADNRITKKIGIHSRHVAKSEECASDLAFHAAEKIFSSFLKNSFTRSRLIQRKSWAFRP